MAELFSSLDLIIVAQGELGIDSIEESGSTFAENALLKARHAARLAGLPAVADDSGLSVDAIGGRPGVRSARFAGESASDQENIDKLLAELHAVPDAERTAAFHCAAVFAEPGEDTKPVIAEGRWPGVILRQREGRGGFGYDPVFFDPVAGKSAAVMSAAEKNAHSHRGRAFTLLQQMLRADSPAA